MKVVLVCLFAIGLLMALNRESRKEDKVLIKRLTEKNKLLEEHNETLTRTNYAQEDLIGKLRVERNKYKTEIALYGAQDTMWKTIYAILAAEFANETEDKKNV